MRKLLMITVVALGVAACTTTENQKLLNADDAYAVTQQRALKYVSLPACDGGNAPACADPAAEADVKATVKANQGAEGSAAVGKADAELTATLARHVIDCGAAATATCP